MRSGEMNSLLRGIDNALQVYSKHVVDNLANKEDIVPPVPILTRYRSESGFKAFVKKELNDSSSRMPDMRKSRDINVMTTSTLCVQLNTLYLGLKKLTKSFIIFYNSMALVILTSWKIAFGNAG
uniref:PATROL1-like C-terminal domain-containing protein n=1 Tax=Lactuca sativa TaxID=4236 RepID=A0A9R1UEI6_LACSA|nr:hypothetical protein LSAT_V11C900478430 [Lactuca sativa]